MYLLIGFYLSRESCISICDDLFISLWRTSRDHLGIAEAAYSVCFTILLKIMILDILNIIDLGRQDSKSEYIDI